MIAATLALPVGLVEVSDAVVSVARRLVAEGLPGVAVIGSDGRPLAVLPASQVLGLAVPSYVKEDPSLAGVLDEATADLIGARLAGMTVQHVLDDAEPDLAGTIAHDATLLEIAAVMARRHAPLLVVVAKDGQALGTVSARDVIDALLPSA